VRFIWACNLKGLDNTERYYDLKYKGSEAKNRMGPLIAISAYYPIRSFLAPEFSAGLLWRVLSFLLVNINMKQSDIRPDFDLNISFVRYTFTISITINFNLRTSSSCVAW
jgi:hypothetical protein